MHKECKPNFHTKIHEALFIKKFNLGLNRQLFANGSSFLINVFFNNLVLLLTVIHNA